MNPLPVLAEHAASWRDAALAPEVEHAARRALIDWFAALLPGCRLPPSTLMAAALRRSGIEARAVDATGVVTLLGGGVPVGEIRAVF